jgi:leucyl-tRNA synthetase
MAAYPFTDIEAKWQAYWERERTFRVPDDIDTAKPKYYVLDMFPYPSGDGLHVGHPEGYTASDIVARYKRMRGFNVLHPIGWDAFGLPAEQYALKTGTHPRETTARNVERFRAQLKSLGFSYDWEREVNTTDPGYYRWTQWIFKQFFERGLAYQEENAGLVVPRTRHHARERGGHRRQVGSRRLPLRAPAAAPVGAEDYGLCRRAARGARRPRLARQHEGHAAQLDRPQRGCRDRFRRCPATRASASACSRRGPIRCSAPPIWCSPRSTSSCLRSRPTRSAPAVDAYREQAARKSELERAELQKDKTGVFTGAYAENPATGEPIPVWIADYVLAGYGTGAIMAVPGQDQRDWEFANAHGLPVIRTVEPPADFDGEAYLGDGPAINSGFLNGLSVAAAKEKMIAWLEREKHGRRHVNYKLRDWLFSRQRYWGEPFPIIFVDGEPKVVPDDVLPVELPDLAEFKPSGSPEGPLATAKGWLDTSDPDTGGPARRETNTMPQWAGSCWYYLRYIDPHNRDALVDPVKERYWMPVDLYIGGSEHAVLHLLYARFWHKVLYDAGVVSTPEPFAKLVHQGMILGELEYTKYVDDDGQSVSAEHVSGDRDRRTGAALRAGRVTEDDVLKQGDRFVLRDAPDIAVDARAHKMSKSRGNVVNPDDVVARYGADAFRLYEMFMGPLEQVKPWSTRSVEGTSRFLNRFWRLIVDEQSGSLAASVSDDEPSPEQLRQLHRTIAKVTGDLEALRFNTAIAALMEFTNAATKWPALPRSVIEPAVLLLAPLAPHIAEELWARLGHEQCLAYESWPEADSVWLRSDTISIAVQVNGKLRGRIDVAADATEGDVLAIAKRDPNVVRHLEGKAMQREIYVPGRIVNFVVRG